MTGSRTEYLRYLAGERHMFAWTLRRYGGLSAQAAKQRALEFYPQEPLANEYRWLVFHDSAWHWAMIDVFGEQYWIARPDLVRSDAEYQAESERWDAGKATR